MASRIFNGKKSLEREIKEVYARISIGASGAPTLDVVQSEGVTSVVRNSAGNYTLTLDQPFRHLRSFAVMHLSSTAQDLNMNLVSESVANSSSKQLNFVCLTAATETDPEEDTVLFVKMDLKNVNNG